MQQLEDFVAHPGGHRTSLVLGAAVGALQHRLRQFEIPVAEDVPYEAIGCARSLVELIRLDRLGDLAHGLAGLVRDPAAKLGTVAQWLISAKRQAFHSLVAKLR